MKSPVGVSIFEFADVYSKPVDRAGLARAALGRSARHQRVDASALHPPCELKSAFQSSAALELPSRLGFPAAVLGVCTVPEPLPLLGFPPAAPLHLFELRYQHELPTRFGPARW